MNSLHYNGRKYQINLKNTYGIAKGVNLQPNSNEL